MRKFTIFAAAAAAGALLVSASSALAVGAPSWRIVSTDDESLTVIDANSIHRQGDTATATIAVLFAKPNTADFGNFTFMVFQDKYDCAQKTEQAQSVIFMDETGTVVKQIDALNMEVSPADGDNNRSTNRAVACGASKLDDELKVDSLPTLRNRWLQVLAKKN
jgi:hypothetical protein